jgi:hypothetical protein
MVKGLDVFKKHFESFDSMFVVIGGTASTLVLEDGGLDFRATKDYRYRAVRGGSDAIQSIFLIPQRVAGTAPAG